MFKLDAEKSGSFKIGGDIEIHRLGFGAMRITGTVQNRYNLVDRGSEDVLEYCEQNRIGFIPWAPLAAGQLAKPGSILDRIAKAHNAAPSQIALAWMLKRSRVILPAPRRSSTSKRMSPRSTSS